MESWLPWLSADEHLFTDLLAERTRGSCWSSPGGCATGRPSCSTRRWRSPRRLATTWGAARRGPTRRGERFPRLHLALRPAACPPTPRSLSILPVAERPRASPAVHACGWPPGARRRGAARCRPVRRARRRRVTAWSICADGRGSGRAPGGRARRRRGLVRSLSSTEPTRAPTGRPGRCVGRRSTAGFVAPELEARRRWPSPTSPAGGARTARPGRGPRPTEGFFDDLAPGELRRAPPARRGPLRRHGDAARSAGAERDYLLLEYRGGDRLYVPVRPDRRDHALHRRRVADAQPAGRSGVAAAARPGCAPRSARSPRSWSCSTGAAWPTPGHAFAARHALAARARGRPSPTPRPPTSSRPSTT